MTTRRDFLATLAAVIALPKITQSKELVNPWFYNATTARKAQNVLTPATVSDVVEALERVRAQGAGFAVRSGGHCFEGFSQHDVAQINMGRLTTINWTGEDTITAGPGATVGNVNQFLGPTGRVLPAGYCQGVALGGHASGGGVGLYSRRFGLTADHLVSVTLVTADGQIITASDDAHADLFWALRGGGAGSFGLVTAYEFKVRRVARAMYLRFDWRGTPAEIAQLVADWHQVSETLPRSIGAVCYLRHLGRGVFGAELKLQSTASDDLTRSMAARIYGLRRPVSDPDVKIGAPQYVADEFWARNHNPVVRLKAMSDYLRRAVPAPVWRRVLDLMAATEPYHLSLAMDLLGGAVDDVAPSATAYPHRGTGQTLIQYALSLEPDGNEATLEILRSIKGLMRGYASGGTYVNYPDRELPDYATAYWGANLERLQHVKTKYDPENVFRHPHSVPLSP